MHKLCGRRARTPTSDEAQRHRLESLDMGGPEHHVIITVIMVCSRGLKILPNIVSDFDKKYVMEESRISRRVCRQRWTHTRDDRGHGEGKAGQWTSIERWGKNPKCSFVRRFLWRQKVRSCIAATPPQTADVRWLVWFCRRETKARRRFSFPLPFPFPVAVALMDKK